VLRKRVAADESESLRIDGAGACTRGCEQSNGLAASDAGACHAVEPGSRNNLPSLASAATFELCDQVAHRLITMRE
jgi:hypothetical protein